MPSHFHDVYHSGQNRQIYAQVMQQITSISQLNQIRSMQTLQTKVQAVSNVELQKAMNESLEQLKQVSHVLKTDTSSLYIYYKKQLDQHVEKQESGQSACLERMLATLRKIVKILDDLSQCCDSEQMEELCYQVRKLGIMEEFDEQKLNMQSIIKTTTASPQFHPQVANYHNNNLKNGGQHLQASANSTPLESSKLSGLKTHCNLSQSGGMIRIPQVSEELTSYENLPSFNFMINEDVDSVPIDNAQSSIASATHFSFSITESNNLLPPGSARYQPRMPFLLDLSHQLVPPVSIPQANDQLQQTNLDEQGVPPPQKTAL
ncbi:hypothetical protein FGO68_gene15720 [Halteria grandinella]|uniref:Uncharacterized protein n=1 Tax=Halteria grandinella TaxID=5974 RepID=A0A8J8NTD3_HALGN|nr:hypothetical protein FGO68_gene15720 [Halteria grandinella]